MKRKTFNGEDGLHSTIDPSSSEAISDDLGLEPKHKIFLSHSGAQKEFVDHLCKALEERHHYPFFDERHPSLPKGMKFPSLIFKAVQQCQLCVVVISEEYFMSKWPMIELNAFVKAKREMQSNINSGILPLFYGLSVSDLKDDTRRQRWFEKWEAFARDDPKGLINVDDWKYALCFLTVLNGLSYNRESKQVLEYMNEVVSSICTLVTPDFSSLLKETVTEFAGLSVTSLLTFPAGDPDPVRIEDEDLQSLQPRRHLSINVVDFYIKYLEKEVLTCQDNDRFFFFNCSFFISTFGTKIYSTDIYNEQARQWIRGVNLFEKDYVFIPVHKSEHWSLIIIYHLNCLTGSPTDVHYRSPRILHLNSVEGKDGDLEADIRSFILDSWTAIHRNSDILKALFRMKYVEAKVPQGGNGYDSGIYLLHYVEHFILESASPDFRFGTEQGKLNFPGWDTSSVVAKRKHIQNLIFKLSGMTQLQGTLRLHSSEIFSWLRFKAASEGRIEDVQNSDLTMVNGKGAESDRGGHQTGGVTVLNEHRPFDVNETLLRDETRLPEMGEIRGLRQADNDTPILRKGRPRVLNWSPAETSVLLDCVVRFDRLPQGNNATRWDFIAGELDRLGGTRRDGNQCRSRFDTLSKAFKQVNRFCKDNAKGFSEITAQERLEMRLSTTLTEEWYTLMAQHYTYQVNYRKSGKDPSDCPTSSAGEIQIEALADSPTRPRIVTDNIPSSSAGEFQSEILPEPPPASPNNRQDGTPVPESLLATDPRPLVQRKRFRRDEDEMKGVYRRAVKNSAGAISRYRYEPRFKPPRDTDTMTKYSTLSLGSYDTPEEAKDVREIAAYYYGRSDGRLDLGDGTHFPIIPGCDSVELQSLRGKEKMVWVQGQAKKVFAAFQMEKARLKLGLDLDREEDQLSAAIPNPGLSLALPDPDPIIIEMLNEVFEEAGRKREEVSKREEVCMLEGNRILEEGNRILEEENRILEEERVERRNLTEKSAEKMLVFRVSKNGALDLYK